MSRKVPKIVWEHQTKPLTRIGDLRIGSHFRLPLGKVVYVLTDHGHRERYAKATVLTTGTTSTFELTKEVVPVELVSIHVRYCA